MGSRTWMGLLVRAMLGALLYLAFASKLEWPELCMSVVAGALAATGIYWLRRIDRQQVRFIVPPPIWVAQLAIKMVSDSAKVTVALASAVLGHTVGGRLKTIGFESGGSDGRCAARRTFVTLGKSLPPNGIVIFIDRYQQRLLLHELAPSQAADEPREWPT